MSHTCFARWGNGFRQPAWLLKLSQISLNNDVIFIGSSPYCIDWIYSYGRVSDVVPTIGLGVFGILLISTRGPHHKE